MECNRNLPKTIVLVEVIVVIFIFHDVLVGDHFEELLHFFFKLLVDGLVADLMLDAHDDAVEGFHDEVVVFAAISELEVDVGVVEVVVLELVAFVHLHDCVIHIPVDLLGQRHRVLIEHVVEHLALYVGVDESEVLALQRVPLGQFNQVLQDLL